MARLQHKPLVRPDEVRTYPHGRTEIYQLDNIVIGRMIMEPGWHWAEHVRPLAGTDRCMYHHMGVVVSGVLRVTLEDGTTSDIGPDQAFEIPPGHDSVVIGDEPWVAIDFAGARTFARPIVGSGERILATIVLTDIVGSTETLQRVGDAAWRDLLSEHFAAMQLEVDRYRGREAGSTGDGMLALFDGAERAVRAAADMTKRARTMALPIRVGVHTGEVELVAGGVRGVAVHTAARIAALAEADEVLLSATTADLLAGSTLTFESRGRRELKGLPGEREILALVTSPA